MAIPREAMKEEVIPAGMKAVQSFMTEIGKTDLNQFTFEEAQEFVRRIIVAGDRALEDWIPF